MMKAQMVLRPAVVLPALALAVTLVAVAATNAAPAVPQSLDVTGVSGHVGEWEVIANLSRSGDTRELAGPMTMTHVGWCSQDGAEVRTGQLHVTFARFSSRIDARVLIAGVECTYSASLSDAYTGSMDCPDRKPVPMTVWLR